MWKLLSPCDWPLVAESQPWRDGAKAVADPVVISTAGPLLPAQQWTRLVCLLVTAHALQVMGLPVPSGITSEELSGQPLPLCISAPLPEGFLQQPNQTASTRKLTLHWEEPSTRDGGFGV